jgi:hypothetical protein
MLRKISTGPGGALTAAQTQAAAQAGAAAAITAAQASITTWAQSGATAALVAAGLDDLDDQVDDVAAAVDDLAADVAAVPTAEDLADAVRDLYPDIIVSRGVSAEGLVPYVFAEINPGPAQKVQVVGLWVNNPGAVQRLFLTVEGGGEYTAIPSTEAISKLRRATPST